MAVVRLERSPIHLLHRASQCASDAFQGEVGEGDLTPRQYAVLVAVSQNEGLSQTQLVDSTGIDRSTLADIVRRMQKKGLLQRRRTREDARAYAVKLTDEGRRMLRAAEPLAKRVDERILDALPGQQREHFVDDLSTSIVEALGKLGRGRERRRELAPLRFIAAVLRRAAPCGISLRLMIVSAICTVLSAAPLQQVVGHDPHGQPVLDRRVLADARLT